MSGPLSYEPSIQSILDDVLPPDSRLMIGAGALRRRVSWLVPARATGLGQIEGGEIVVVPAGRLLGILPHLEGLDRIGIGGVLTVDDVGAALGGDSPAGPPVIQLPADTDLRALQSDIERYIARRRRELFALERELHHSFTEAAIGGASIADLLATGARHTGKVVVLDRDGDVLSHPADGAAIPEALLVQVRIASRRMGRAQTAVAGPPPALAAPVIAGSERRGIAMIVGISTGSRDEDEAVLMSLVSACAIALARTPDHPLSTLEDVVTALATETAPPALGRSATLVAVALRDGGSSLRQLDRALTAELSVRNVPHLTGTDRDILLAAAGSNDSLPWGGIMRAVAQRLSSADLRAGVGRERSDSSAITESFYEAQEAVGFAAAGATVHFQQVELASLLRSSPRWMDFARARLGPILSGTAANGELLRTLRAYLAAGRNAKEAARELHVHRNTLLYRMRRLREVLGLDLDDPATVLDLELSMRVVDGVAAATETGDTG